jgi:hypothetical protein
LVAVPAVIPPLFTTVLSQPVVVNVMLLVTFTA